MRQPLETAMEPLATLRTPSPRQPMSALDDLRAACRGPQDHLPPAGATTAPHAAPAPSGPAPAGPCPFTFGPWQLDPASPPAASGTQAPRQGAFRAVYVGSGLVGHWRAFLAPWWPLPDEPVGPPCPTHQIVGLDGVSTLSSTSSQAVLEEFANLLGVSA